MESGKLANVDKVFKYMMSYVYYVHVLWIKEDFSLLKSVHVFILKCILAS